MKYLFLLLGCAILLTTFMARGSQKGYIGSGDEWLSWSPGEQATYVSGFISGYLDAAHSACDAADNLFETGKSHYLGDSTHPSDYPSARCFAQMEDYSKYKYVDSGAIDFTSYTDVITEFYKKHPECRRIQYVLIMRLLSDRNHKTADELYEMTLSGKLHPIR